MTKDAFIEGMVNKCIKHIEWAVHATDDVKASELMDALAERLLIAKQIKEQEEMKMSLLAVLEIIGKGIEDLKLENQALRYERDRLKESEKAAWESYNGMFKERNELKLKLQAAQDYADSLAPKCENVSKTEEIKESGC